VKLLQAPSHPSEALSVSFQGYSNHLSGKRLAILSFVNRDARELELWGASVVYRDGYEPKISAEHSLVGFKLRRGESRYGFLEVPPHDGQWSFGSSVSRLSPMDHVQKIVGSRAFLDWLDEKLFQKPYDIYMFRSEWMP
jgi:hypothetical protein